MIFLATKAIASTSERSIQWG